MKKYVLTLLSSTILSAFVNISPAHAFGWPTFDIGEVFNTIISGISQVESQVSTAMETYSVANLQQAIGDKLGGLQKIKDAQEKIKKAQEKIEKAQKRAQKVVELKKKYEQAAKDAIGNVQNAYDTAQGYVENAKNQVENAKNQVENTINNAKNQVENAKNQVENTVNNVKNQVENAKNQVENTVNNVKGQVENARDRIESTVGGSANQGYDAFRSDEDNFDFENSSSGFGNNRTGNANTGNFNNNAAEVDWGDGLENSLSGETTIGSGVTQGNDDVLPDQRRGGFGFVEEQDEVLTEVNTGFRPQESDGNVDLSADGRNSINSDNIAEIDWGDGSDEGTLTEVNIAVRPADDGTGLRVMEENVEPLPALPNKKGNILSKEGEINEGNLPDVSEDGQKVILIKERTEPQAFEKVSYNRNFKAGFAAQGSDFKTGTDDDGNFYFPDAFANWVGLNFDDTADEDKLWAGIEKICADLHSPENYKTGSFDHRFNYEIIGVMRANAQAHSAVGANEAESGGTVNDLDNMINTAGGTTMTQISGLGELDAAQIRKNRQDIVRLSDELMSRVFDEIQRYCYHWNEKEE